MKESEDIRSMTLEQAEVEKQYCIQQLLMGGNTQRRLEALGMIKGTSIIVLSKKKNGTLIYKMRGTRYAIGKGIASNIEVEEEV